MLITRDLTGVSSCLIKPEVSISKPDLQNKADFTGVLWGFEPAHGLLCTQWRENLAVPVWLSQQPRAGAEPRGAEGLG